MTFASFGLSKLIFAAGRFVTDISCRHTGGANSGEHISGFRFLFAWKSLCMSVATWYDEVLFSGRDFSWLFFLIVERHGKFCNVCFVLVVVTYFCGRAIFPGTIVSTHRRYELMCTPLRCSLYLLGNLCAWTPQFGLKVCTCVQTFSMATYLDYLKKQIGLEKHVGVS